MKTNIYHVIWDNDEPWAEDADERHGVVAANTPEEACEKMYLDAYDKTRGSIHANLCFKDVIIPD